MPDVAVMCIHGLGRGASDWDRVRDGLQRFGEVRAPDLVRGTVDEVAAALAGLPPANILIGHSLGGVVALRLAAAPGTPVTAVVLTGCFFPPARNGRSRTATVAGYASHRFALARELTNRGVRPRPRAGTARAMRSLADLGLRPQAFQAAARAVRAPVLVVHGRQDHYVPVDFAFAATTGRPSWTLRVVEDCGHDVHIDRPAEWLALTSAWLDSLSGRQMPAE